MEGEGNQQKQALEDEKSRVEALEEQVQTLSQTSQAALENLDKMSSHARKLAKEVCPFPAPPQSNLRISQKRALVPPPPMVSGAGSMIRRG